MENDRVEVEKRARIRSHHDLKVWQLGMEIALDVYRHTQSFPKEEIYSVTNQMRRSATSVPANIVEGNARESTKEYLRHLSIAIGSLAELETFLILGDQLGYGNRNRSARILDLIAEEGRMIRGLQKSLKSKL